MSDPYVESEQRHKLLVEAMSQGVIHYDASGAVIAMNPAAERILGQTREDFKRCTLPDSEHPAIREDGSLFADEDHPLSVALRTGQAVRDVVMGVLNPREKALHWISIDAVPLTRPGEGEPLEVYAVFSDITERRRVEQALREREKERKRAEDALHQANEQLRDVDRRKNEFLGVLSHELRNPLAPISNSLYILEHVAPGSAQAKRAQAVMRRQTDQLTRLVDDLLDVTRIGRNKVELQRQRLNLNELLYRTIEDHRLELARAGVGLSVDVVSAPLFVSADSNRLAQVIGNLLQNAAKFTPSGGRVDISLAADAGEALLRVADSGVGLAPGVAAHLFEPFVQADTTLDRSKGGLGLGLALVKGLVELHGGHVSANSPGPGMGSTFTVRLPLDGKAPLAAAPVRTNFRTARMHVLVIEDNRDAAETLREVLELGGHQVVVAYNGADGIAKALASHPDVVFCDIGLPGMDGYAVARALRVDASLNGVHLIALSGYALPDDLRRATEAGFEGHLAKPPSIEALEAMLSQLAAPV